MKGEWQPIETAPRDQLVILYWPAPINDVESSQFNTAKNRWPHRLLWMGVDGADDDLHIVPPTHWMPLPEPPQ